MSVSITDKRRSGKRISGLDVANGTWFAILAIPGVDALFSTERTNDPINCTPAKARKLAGFIGAWEPPTDWFGGIGFERGKELFISFLNECNGFRTH